METRGVSGEPSAFTMRSCTPSYTTKLVTTYGTSLRRMGPRPLYSEPKPPSSREDRSAATDDAPGSARARAHDDPAGARAQARARARARPRACGRISVPVRTERMRTASKGQTAVAQTAVASTPESASSGVEKNNTLPAPAAASSMREKTWHACNAQVWLAWVCGLGCGFQGRNATSTRPNESEPASA